MTITTEQKQEMVKTILDTLTKQRFNDFYTGMFEDFVTREPKNPPTEAEVLAKIETLFQL
jgi:hypothetical protein